MDVSEWIVERPAFLQLCRNNAHVHALMRSAVRDNWSVERFLEECVTVLGQVNASLSSQLLKASFMAPPPPIVIGDAEYRYSP